MSVVAGRDPRLRRDPRLAPHDSGKDKGGLSKGGFLSIIFLNDPLFIYTINFHNTNIYPYIKRIDYSGNHLY